MNNYNKLLEMEKELLFIRNASIEEDPLFISKLEMLYCLYVTNIHTGEMGFIKRGEEENLVFFVTLTEGETIINENQLNDEYIQTPKHILNMRVENPRFILSPYIDSVGVIEETDLEEKTFTVVWDDDHAESIEISKVKWISKLVGVKKEKICK